MNLRLLERGNVRRSEIDPFTILPLLFKSSVPIRFNAAGRLCDNMHGL